METRIRQYQNKFKDLLEKLVHSDGHNGINSNLENLFNKLKIKESTGKPTLVDLPVFIEWLSYAVSVWWAKKITPPTHILSFTLNLASVLMKKEENFVFFNSTNYLSKLLTISKVKNCESAQPVSLSYIRLLISLVGHKSGIEWLIFYNIWEDIFHLSLTTQHSEESYKFISKFLDVVIDHDENFCANTIKQIMSPISEKIHNNIFENMETSLKVIANILEYFFDEVFYSRGDSRVLSIFSKNFHLEDQIFDLLLLAQNENLAFDFCKIMFILQFLELYVNVINNTITLQASKQVIDKIMNNYIICMSRGNYEDILIFCNFSYLYFNVVSTKMSPYRLSNQDEIVSFANQFALLEVQPNFAIILKHCISQEEAASCNNSSDNFIEKVFKMCGPEVFRLLFFWRDLLPTFPNLVDLSMTSLTCIKKSMKHYSKEVAVMMFQSLLFTIRDFVRTMQESPEFFKIIGDEYDYFSFIFDLLAILIDKFQITWRDSLETTDMMSIIFDFICLSPWPSKVMVGALNLLNVSIVRHMTPNLALLVDRTADSTIALLGPLLFQKIYVEDSSVKAAALEIICSIARVSAKKLPSLQKMLIDSRLPALILKGFILDRDASVRATSIRCLQEMIKAKEILSNILNIDQLLHKAKDILLNETQAMVRVEAATFICVAYDHQQIPKDILEKVYVSMVLSATADIHCQVKISVLDFWAKVINNHLENQGMIDGSFPDVTFSKEHRKIIVLTEEEIQKRLLKVLERLSAIGCLGVLISIIKEDCDVEVSKVGLEITQKLIKLIKRYNLGDSRKCAPVHCPDYDEIITPSVCWRKDDIKSKTLVASSAFLDFAKEDLGKIVAERRDYLSGIEDLGFLIDAMLENFKRKFLVYK